MRTIVPSLAALVAALICLTAAAAEAHVIAGQAWPTSTLTYADQAGPRYDQAIREAVQAWNRAAVGVRIRPARPNTTPDLTIVEVAGKGCRGWAPVGYGTDQMVLKLSRGCRKPERALIVAHELGHVLGLGHEDSRCATMNSRIVTRPDSGPAPEHCRGARALRFQRRGLLSGDDVAGARTIHRTPQLNSVTAAPAAAAGVLDVGVDASADAARLDLYRSCGDVRASGVRASSITGETKAFTIQAGSGRHCLAVRAVSRHGRPSRVVRAAPVIVAPSAVMSPERSAASLDEGTAAFRAAPPVPLRIDAGQLRYEWDFGDPSSPANSVTVDRAARVWHNYTSPGTYTVTLRVIHVPSGIAASSTSHFTVAPDLKPVATFTTTKLNRYAFEFDSSGTSDAQCDGWTWDFGDVTSDTRPCQKKTTHTYARPGSYTVRLTVRDYTGNVAAAERVIRVE